MTRRSFVSAALTALASVPVIGAVLPKQKPIGYGPDDLFVSLDNGKKWKWLGRAPVRLPSLRMKKGAIINYGPPVGMNGGGTGGPAGLTGDWPVVTY